ncbi:MarR family transcriptional regulator [Solirubrobacter sp. CPCC 204708]|uniref:MarR family transcriptional regulator n=1 Tax=Solirubrobacter deserti TaxID=2282478 RepID=A0ABT4RJC6_9ACTN|nr:MarR family transcriptional regulator [Solirubrobacter deserti]MBE2317655.1 MarR family transcriptional regulator [Solirubrobacter deserti]MDA0138605.1 MarR family transcriptional regulator [Solirubrobacter deserti]
MDREDLGALFARGARRMMEAERPLLAAHGVSMWAYVALTLLARGSAPTQLALAEAMGYDKSRLIKILDGLEADGLISRAPDPADRRARVIELTPEGRAKHAAIQRDVRRVEDEILSVLGADERETLLSALARLTAGASPDATSDAR